MKLTQRIRKAARASAVPADSRPLAQPFDALLARYKARVYERYSHEIGGREAPADVATHPVEVDSPAPDQQRKPAV